MVIGIGSEGGFIFFKIVNLLLKDLITVLLVTAWCAKWSVEPVLACSIHFASQN